jgi:hypothetical protein
MDRLSLRGLPRGSVARVLRARAARGKNRKYASYRRGAREEDARRPSPAPPGGVWGHLSRRVVDGVGWDERARLPRPRGRDSPRVAKTTSAQARVCFELNAAVAVVAVLVLLHTSFTSPRTAGLCRCQGALIRNRRRSVFVLHCCDNRSPITTITHARVRPNSVGALRVLPLNKLAKANGATTTHCRASGEPWPRAP